MVRGRYPLLSPLSTDLPLVLFWLRPVSSLGAPPPLAAGYTGNGTHCQDINECELVVDGSKGSCDRLTKCTNQKGSFTCSACPPGSPTPALTRIDDLHAVLFPIHRYDMIVVWPHSACLRLRRSPPGLAFPMERGRLPRHWSHRMPQDHVLLREQRRLQHGAQAGLLYKQRDWTGGVRSLPRWLYQYPLRLQTHQPLQHSARFPSTAPGLLNLACLVNSFGAGRASFDAAPHASPPPFAPRPAQEPKQEGSKTPCFPGIECTSYLPGKDPTGRGRKFGCAPCPAGYAGNGIECFPCPLKARAEAAGRFTCWGARTCGTRKSGASRSSPRPHPPAGVHPLRLVRGRDRAAGAPREALRLRLGPRRVWRAQVQPQRGALL